MPQGFAAWVPLASTILTSSTNTVTFSNLPQTGYKDLVIVCDTKSNQDQDVVVSFNGSSSNFSGTRMVGYNNGSIYSADYPNSNGIIVMTASNGIATEINIMSYTSTNKHKVVVTRGGASNFYSGAFVHRWASTASISSMTIYQPNYQFVAGASFNVYGIVG